MSLEFDAELALTTLNLPVEHVQQVYHSFQRLRPLYHNEEHCYSTALTFLDLSRAADLECDETRDGFVAALYHDAAHYEDPEDAGNIEGAINWFLTIPQYLHKGIDVERVIILIASTLNTQEERYSLTEELLHDADLLQTVKGSEEENQHWQGLLSKELGIRVTPASSREFVLKKLKTPYAQDLLKLA